MSESNADATLPDTKPIDPFVCPRGHHGVKLSATRFRCQTCRRQGRETVTWDKAALVDLREAEPPLVEDDQDPEHREYPEDDEDKDTGASEVFFGP